jgi:peptidyl-prolyl cis-trans isomerase SurA
VRLSPHRVLLLGLLVCTAPLPLTSGVAAPPEAVPPLTSPSLTNAFGAGTPLPGAPLDDRVVAWVDEESLTLSELREAVEYYESQGDIAPDEPGEAKLRKARERWIDEALILAQARRRQIEIPAESLDNRVTAILDRMEKNLGGPEAFSKYLSGIGKSRRALREQIRTWTRREWLLAHAVNDRITITDEDVKRFVAEREKESQPTGRCHVSHLFLPVGKGAPEERWKEAEERGRKALAAIGPGHPFAEIAAAFAESHGDEGVRGGFLGIVEPKELQPELASALEKLEAGTCSEPIRTDRGVHFLYLERKTTPREILYTIRFAEERAKWIEELRRKATIQEGRL